MPPLKVIPTLFETCLKYYGRHCCKSLIAVLTWQHEAYNTDKGIVTERRDLLFERAKRYFREHTIVHTRKDLLNCVIEEIVSSKSEMIWDIFSYCITIHGGEWIQELDFAYDELEYAVPTEDDQPDLILLQTLYQNPSWSKSLVSLKLPVNCHFKMIKMVGCHCHNLKHLDISKICKSYFQDDLHLELSCIANLRYLYGAAEYIEAGCPKLETIALPQWEGKPEVIDHIVKMIHFMPNLHVIQNVDTRLVAIKYMNATGQSSVMKLTEFEEWEKEMCRGAEYDIVNEVLGKIFPKVKRYASFCWNHNSQAYFNQHLQKIKMDFPCLQIIEIYKYYTDLIEDITSMEPMPSVKIFKVCEFDDTVGLDKIKALCEVFPNLEKLILYSNCYCADIVDDVRVDDFFKKLNTLELNAIAELDAEFLLVFLEKCPALKTLQLLFSNPSLSGTAPAITDEFVSKLSGMMDNLETLILKIDSETDPMTPTFSKLELTYNSVLCILSGCPNLRILGDLVTWNVTEQQVNDIVESIRKNNFDLSLIYNERLRFK